MEWFQLRRRPRRRYVHIRLGGFTQRIDGWQTTFHNESSAERAPYYFHQTISQHKTSEGAFFTIRHDSPLERSPEYDDHIIDDNYPLGDKTIIWLFEGVFPDGSNKFGYTIMTSYRNYVFTISGASGENGFNVDFLIPIAENALEKLLVAPLADPLN